MKTLLHIAATPRGDESRTLKVSRVFLEAFKNKYSKCLIEELNLFDIKLPDLTVQRVDGKYELLSGKEISPKFQVAWDALVEYINQFKRADGYLISAPMWNFGIPYKLKHYFDVIVQPKYLFQYTDKGPEGLIKNKKMVVITSRGGDYTQPGFKVFDQEEPYLKTVLGFIGLTDVKFIHAQPMDMGADAQKAALEKAKTAAKRAAEKF